MLFRSVRLCEERGIELAEMTDADLAAVSGHLTSAVRDVLTVEGSLASRSGVGGTAPVRVAEQLGAARASAADLRGWAGS